ncbi:endonuclease/exonuclease/phosphatase family protein [Desulfobacula sp.]|uniref:endonuclease/exonuclease/phosphatase family protein n=1 Tax=Desulfobacula sp. TaxID=2593537 RepID=UPI0026040CBF|nr:endonuclease/exonuclease/phosphatase family protein [Desulfobacula sp.]
MKKVIKIVFGLVCILVLGFVCLVGYATISDYRPDPTSLVFEKQDARVISSQKNYKLLIWNIGYGGLSRDMDFFYDGGKQVRPARQIVEENISAIETFIARRNDIDFFLLQEVDQKSKRSYSIDGYLKIEKLFPQFHSSFGKNYDVFFVPVPPSNPLGSVLSGLQTLARFEPISVIRHSFPGNYAWPQGLFMLDRCFLVSRYLLETGKELLVINTHNSAYDDGSLRSNQMAYLKNFLIQEYEKGNYVIVGGDWNQCPPNFNPEFQLNPMDNENRMDIEKDYLPEWSWAYDRKIPTNRRLVAPYDQKTTLTTVIDFFLVSPNIEVKQVQGIYLDFEHSDHHPVKLEVSLK